MFCANLIKIKVFMCSELGELLEWFSSTYQNERNFSTHQHKQMFLKVFNALLEPKGLS